MKHRAGSLTAEQVQQLREKIDFSDIPEITDLTGFKLRNCQALKQALAQDLSSEKTADLRRGEGAGKQQA